MSYRDTEKEIKRILNEDGKDVYFECDWIDIPQAKIGHLVDMRDINLRQAQVLSFTVNKSTNEKFLLKSAIGDSIEECMSKILEFVNKSNQYNTFTVNWAKIENGIIGKYNTSFFYCHDMMEVINKFFTGKNIKDYVIYNIKLNPMS